MTKNNPTNTKWYKRPEIIIPIIIALVSIPWLPSLFNSLTSNNNSPTKAESTQTRKYSIQRKINDGEFEINLYDIVCGSKKYSIYEAKGEFCVVDVLIVNRGKATDNVWSDNWKLYVGDREFKTTSNEGKAFEDILPSSSGNGTVAFDITIGSAPNSIVVFGPCCTNGVKIDF